MTITALDLFAGSGWGVACKRLGIEEMGVELMPEAIETRRLNGMATVYEDVWDGLLLSAEDHEMLYGPYDVLIASPPCQTFSLAGKGAGRQALNEVLEAVQLHAYKSPAELLAFGEKHDLRTALVLSPLAYVYRDRPRYVVLEQVPAVLPVWEEYAKVMTGWGYDVKTDILNAEQYGVPQTRRRAILTASLDGEAMLPVPSHSRYYSRNPKKLDPGVLPWVSMAEALGWNREGTSFTQNNKQAHQAIRPLDSPAPTVTAGHDSGNRGFLHEGEPFRVATPEEVAVLQTYPVYTRQSLPDADLYLRPDSNPRATIRAITEPASTIKAGHSTAERGWVTDPTQDARAEGGALLTVDQAAVLQTYPGGRGLTDRPSPTVTGGGTETGGAEPVAKWHERYTGAEGWQGSTDRLSTDEAAALQTYPVSVRTSMGTPKVDGRNGSHTLDPHRRPAHTLTTMSRSWTVASGEDVRKLNQDEAAALQTYPEEPPFRFAGTKSKQFLQIGNAVPPLLAQRILEAQVMAGELI